MSFLVDSNTITRTEGDFAYQDIIFSTPKQGTDNTGLIASTTYEFRYIFDTMSSWNSPSWSWTPSPDFNTVLASINANFASFSIPAQAMMYNGGIRIIGPARGPHGRVRVDDFNVVTNPLFSDMTDFSAFDTPVEGTPLAGYQSWSLTTVHDSADTAIGTPGTYAVNVTINGLVSNVSVDVVTTITYADLAQAINDQLSNGWCEFYRDRFIIHSNIGGTGTSVSIADINLFANVTDANPTADTAVPGDSAVPTHPVITLGPTSVAAGTVTDVEITAGELGSVSGAVRLTGGSATLGNPGFGGSAELNGGNGGDTSAVAGDSDGGFVGLYAGSALSGDNDGGYIEIIAGGGNGVGNGGGIYLNAGSAGSGGNGDGGNINISAGEPFFDTVAPIAGGITLTAANGVASSGGEDSSVGGTITIVSGSTANVAATDANAGGGDGGDIAVTSGSGATAEVTDTGTGGNADGGWGATITFQTGSGGPAAILGSTGSGTSQATGGYGGSITLTASAGGNAETNDDNSTATITGGNGGNITISAGNPGLALNNGGGTPTLVTGNAGNVTIATGQPQFGANALPEIFLENAPTIRRHSGALDWSDSAPVPHRVLETILGRHTNSTATWEKLYIDGNSISHFLTIPSNRAWMFSVDIVAASDDTGGDESAAFHIKGCIENIAGAVSMVGSPIVTLVARDDTNWDVQAIANDTENSLDIEVMADGEDINWVAVVRIVETTRTVGS